MKHKWIALLGIGALSLLSGIPSAASVEPEVQGPPSNESEAELTARLMAEHPGEVLTFSVDQAEKLGYDFSPPPGLEECRLDPNFRGYDTAEEAAKAAARADTMPECAISNADIASITIGYAEPTADHTTEPYHHSGQQTTQYNFKGGQGSFKVKDITSLNHPGAGQQFVADRILMKRQASPSACQKPSDNDRWSEVGWWEHSWEANDRLMYTWSSQNCLHVVYSPPLTDDNFYVFRAKRINGGTRTTVLWSGTWTVLMDYNQPDCFPSGSSALCSVEDYVEVFTAVNGNHPDWASTIGNRELQLWKANDDWIVWGSGVSTSIGDVAPYKRCGVSDYDYFTVEKTSGACP